MRKQIGITALVAMSIATTGCSMLIGERLGMSEDEGRFLLSTDRAGMEAFGDALTGLVITGKADAHNDNTHHQLRREQTGIRKMRYTVPAKSATRSQRGQK